MSAATCGIPDFADAHPGYKIRGLRVMIIAIDIGGTFTDLIGFDERAQRFVEAKSLTTPAHLVQGMIDCLRKSGINGAAIDELIHGSTIAINTLIERTGAKIGLVVSRGTRDVYVIGRGNRPEAYNLFFHRHRPLVRRHLTREVDERLLSSGEVLAPLDRESVAQACRVLAAAGVEAVAVCFLHSYANPEHERIAGEMAAEAEPSVLTGRLSTAVPRCGEVASAAETGLGRNRGSGDQVMTTLRKLMAAALAAGPIPAGFPARQVVGR